MRQRQVGLLAVMHVEPALLATPVQPVTPAIPVLPAVADAEPAVDVVPAERVADAIPARQPMTPVVKCRALPGPAVVVAPVVQA